MFRVPAATNLGDTLIAELAMPHITLRLGAPVVGKANTTEADQLYLLRYPWENSPIKVGNAKDITTRVHSLESGHNFKLQVLTIFLGQGRLERKVHALLSEHRAANGRGHEWFNVTLQQALTAVALAIANCVHSGPIADLA